MFGPNITKMTSREDVAGLLEVAAAGEKHSQAAILAIEGMGELAVDELATALFGGSLLEAVTAANCLRSIAHAGSEQARTTLLASLTSPKALDEVCIIIVGLIAEFEGDEVASALVDYLEGPRSLLTSMRDPGVLEDQMSGTPLDLIGLVGAWGAGHHDPRHMQLAPALKALTKLGNPIAAGVFLQALAWREPTAAAFEEVMEERGLWSPTLNSFRGCDDEIRLLAAKGIACLRDRDSVPVLAAILTKLDENDRLKAEVARALGEIGDPEAVPVLAANLHEPACVFVEDGDDTDSLRFKDVARIRVACARALAAIGTQEARLALERSAASPGSGESRAAKGVLKQMDALPG